MVGDRPRRSRPEVDYNLDKNAGLDALDDDLPRGSASGSPPQRSNGPPKIKFRMPGRSSQPPPPSNGYPDQHDDNDNDAYNNNQTSHDNLVKTGESDYDELAMTATTRSRRPATASGSSHDTRRSSNEGGRTTRNNGNHHLNAASRHPNNDHNNLSRAPPPPISSGRTTRNSAHQVKSEELTYPNADGQGRSQAQLQAHFEPGLEHQDGDGEYTGEAEGDDDADASGEPDYEDDEEADPLALQPGDGMDGLEHDGAAIDPALAGDQEDVEGDEAEEKELAKHKKPEPSVPYTSRRGRMTTKLHSFAESESDADSDAFENSIEVDDMPEETSGTRRSKRTSDKVTRGVDDEDRSESSNGRRRTKLRSRAPPQQSASRKSSRITRRRSQDEDYEDGVDEDDDLDEEVAELRDTTPNLSDHSSDVVGARPSRGKKNNGRGRNIAHSTDDDQPITRKLRERTNKVNYSIIPLPPDEAPGRNRSGGGGSNLAGPSQHYGGFLMDMTRGAGALADPNMPNMPDSDSDDDAPDYIKELRKEASSTVALANGGVNRGKKANVAAGPSTATVAAGTVGRYNPEAARADADPLGVDLNVTFDQVGGLDGHINQLKEMVALPLLYPELFQQFGITPPRGVLFHGPPGTGKTLLARALAASCSSSSQKIAFFMRKGADCLSKWVGEAERQLRLLFEEAKNAQPSIIFFDEIDGLAPVRSSKQDQVHSSLVATLLALMDGMDGRGQVIVIGATNRPDSVDPALRRPGRFDREFYFPLPNKEARKKIIGINTRKWDPPLEDNFLDELAGVTKGYGGADLRALCTEAALNAIQRRYPQVYKTNDRLLLDPSSIHVQARDFMASVKKIVPSSARSAASSAQPIPAHLEPLLGETLQDIVEVLEGLIPNKKTKTVLEEAEWEDDNADGTFGRELLMRSFENLRVYRPRLLLHGQKGMGQRFFGAALLHHLEGYHVQNLDIATLLGQSTATIETMLVQMFVEAKRHQPSVLYIPALTQWSAVLTPTAKATFGTLLDSLTPSEPVIIIAFMDEPIAELDPEIQSWFGRMGDNLIGLEPPEEKQIQAYFADIVQKIELPPDQFPDALPKRRRILEELPKAKPLPPPAPTAAALAEQATKDQTLKEIVAFRLNPILTELKKRHNRKSTLTAAEALHRWHQLVERDEAIAKLEREQKEAEQVQAVPDVATVSIAADPAIESELAQPMLVDEPPSNSIEQALTNGLTTVVTAEREHVLENIAIERPKSPTPPPAKPTRPKPHWVDFDLMQEKLMSADNSYYSLRAFERDIFRIQENVDTAEMDLDKRSKAALLAKEATLMIKDHFQDEQQKLEIERMAAREYARKDLSKNKGRKSTSASPTGSRSSNRLSGKGPDMTLPQILQLEKANGKKRSRDGSVDTASLNNDVRAAKRSKQAVETSETVTLPSLSLLDGLSTPRPSPLASGSGTGAGAHAMIAPTFNQDVMAGQIQQRATIVQPPMNGFRDILNPVETQERSTTPELPPAHEDRGPFPHPPFLVSDHGLQRFHEMVLQDTAGFTIEDLEQLHALMLKIVWTHRADWDRSMMIRALLTRGGRFIELVHTGV